MRRILLTILDVVAILLAVVLAQLVAGLNVPALMSNHLYTYLKSDLLAPLIYAGLFYMLFRWLAKHLYREQFPVVQFPPHFKWRYLFVALSLLALVYLGALLVGVAVRYPTLNQYHFCQNLISAIFVESLAAPFVEEVAFWGVILTQIARRYHLWAGIIGSSLLFGLLHLLNGALNLASALQLILAGTLMGILLAVVCLTAGSIWASFTVHALYNLTLDFLPLQATVTHDWPLQLIFTSYNQLITGGQYGADCSLTNICAYALVAGGVLVWGRHQHRRLRLS